jgi:hypothetical protein
MTTPTIETKISQAIQARVATCLPAYPKIWTDGEPASLPTAGGQPAPYVECHFEPNRTVRRFIGSNDPHERPGLLLLTLCWPLTKVGTGSGKTHKDAIREIAGQIASHFQADLPMDFEGVRVRVTAAPSVLGAYRDDAYLRTQVRVTYTCFA